MAQKGALWERRGGYTAFALILRHEAICGHPGLWPTVSQECYPNHIPIFVAWFSVGACRILSFNIREVIICARIYIYMYAVCTIHYADVYG